MKCKIGDRVRVRRFTDMGYVSGDCTNPKAVSTRQPFKGNELTTPQFMTIVGAVRRQCGEYKPQCGREYFGEGEIEPACLIVTGTVMLYQVRKGMFGKIRDVAEEDMELIDSECQLNGKFVLVTQGES